MSNLLEEFSKNLERVRDIEIEINELRKEKFFLSQIIPEEEQQILEYLQKLRKSNE